MKIGILGALPEEVDGVINMLTDCTRETLGMRTYYAGKLNGIDVVVVFSRWGKVAAATTVSALIHTYKVTHVIFTGVAGGIDPTLSIGDIVLGKRFIQHDLDGRPLMKQFEIPLLGKTFIESDEHLTTLSHRAINMLLEEKHLHTVIDNATLTSFGIEEPTLHIGDIASGDQFFYRKEQKDFLHTMLPGILCVEMEGAAVAQVCYEHKVPFTVIRTISDVADENAHVDFPRFIQSISSRYVVEIVRNIMVLMGEK